MKPAPSNPYSRLEEQLSQKYAEEWIPERPGDTIIGELARYATGVGSVGRS